MLKIKHTFLKWRLKNKWRKRLKRKSIITLRIENLNQFFKYLDDRKIRYSSLRWPESVPYDIDLALYSNKEIDETFGDIDLLLELKDVMTLLDICSVRKKGIKIDLYSLYGSKGMHMRGLPYFPPNKGLELLSNSSKEQGFSCPSGLLYIKSLVYHLTYQKALESGIPSGVKGIATKQKPKKDYLQLLKDESKKNKVQLPDEINLQSLHHWLQEHSWSIPLDLLPRWPKKSLFISKLKADFFVKYEQLDKQYPYIIVYVLRGDLSKFPAEQQLIEQKLSSKFELIEAGELSPQQQERAMANLRGGNWLSIKTHKILKPYKYLVYYDKSPELEIDPVLKSKHPEIVNNNIFIKHEIRKSIKLNTGIDNAIHSSDNATEAFYMYEYLSSQSTESLTESIDALKNE
ncbi:hypothetical protein LNTAR_20598 [Lentisphaera araneosa HTCC2155]|uniref:Uncharacterized protein n=1 Tax=Lentisphaera araneosa HTCC2155 TaxID=313628 RepID=A6DL42_9BACT|nr:hypothetical protein [Lentisphaera araneosa]EDM27644.1 hypothetical protein LNTAR_20598 [Lentisphaera araneosa HTCC2155]